MTPQPETFHCDRPTADHKKVIKSLCRTDLLEADVQLLREGGANKPHHHTGQDGFFMVLSGAARFYGPDDEILAELDERDGIVIPHGANYWFEKASDEPAEILHVAAISDRLEDERVGGVTGNVKID